MTEQLREPASTRMLFPGLGRFLLRAAAGLCITVQLPAAHAGALGDGDRVMLQFGPYVAHRVHNSDHNQWPHLLGAEWESPSHWLGGASVFKNSYYQHAAYLYAGRRWFLRPDQQGFYAKISAGLVLGYREPYEDRLPVNDNGLGAGLVPALGYQLGRANAQIVFLGVAGVALTVGYDLWN